MRIKLIDLLKKFLRFDPPLHIFTRYAYEQIDLGDYTIKKGEEVALVLGATGRDKTIWEDPCSFDPDRTIKKNTALWWHSFLCWSRSCSTRNADSFANVIQRIPLHGVRRTPSLCKCLPFSWVRKIINKLTRVALEFL